jgi:hypothetical protein
MAGLMLSSWLSCPEYKKAYDSTIKPLRQIETFKLYLATHYLFILPSLAAWMYMISSWLSHPEQIGKQATASQLIKTFI